MEVSLKKLLLTALAGAIVAFTWGMISWMALPWHHDNFNALTDEVAVGQSLKANAPKEGIYFLPYMAPEDHGNAEKEMKWAEDAAAGPFGFLVIVPDGITHNMGPSMAIQFFTVFIVALLLSIIIGKMNVTCPRGRAVFTMLAALTGALLSHGAHWNWWSFPINYTLVSIAEIAIQWLLAGFVMAKVSDKLKA